LPRLLFQKLHKKISMYMMGWKCTSWSVLTVAVLISLESSCTARSVKSQHQQKRNAWWTKKSVGDGGGFALGESQDRDLDSWSSQSNKVPAQISQEYQEYEDLHPELSAMMSGNAVTIGCYTSECVPALVACARHRTRAAFNVCKINHRECANLCFQK